MQSPIEIVPDRDHFPPKQTTAQRAVELHAQGLMWSEIALLFGMTDAALIRTVAESKHRPAGFFGWLRSVGRRATAHMEATRMRAVR